jgi:Arc/MetJ-type ribon-helix-helix transcriptional regulator
LDSPKLVVRITKQQKHWLETQTADFKTVSDVIRELLDREIAAAKDKSA